MVKPHVRSGVPSRSTGLRAICCFVSLESLFVFLSGCEKMIRVRMAGDGGGRQSVWVFGFLQWCLQSPFPHFYLG